MSRRAFRSSVEAPRPASAWLLVVVASATLWITQQLDAWAIAVQLLAILLSSAKIWRLPRLAGWHRSLVWLSAWMLPLGYVVAALFPGHKKAGLHIVFIAGFAMMAFAVGLHVTLAHGGHNKLVTGRPWQVPLFGVLILAAATMRALVDFDQGRFFVWIGASAAAFLAATIFWALLALPRMLRR